MSNRRRRRSRSGTSVHGGSGNATVGTPVVGDTEATGLSPDHPYDYALTSAVTLTYVEGGGSADTITRGAGSFVTDGWKVGMEIEVTGTVSNNGVYTIATVVALTITLIAADDLAAEVISSTLTSRNSVPGDNTNRDVV